MSKLNTTEHKRFVPNSQIIACKPSPQYVTRLYTDEETFTSLSATNVLYNVLLSKGFWLNIIIIAWLNIIIIAYYNFYFII